MSTVSDSPSLATPEQASRHNGLHLILLLACVLAAFGCWLQWRSLDSMQSTVHAQATALNRMSTDAAHIASLQATPRRASERSRRNEEFLAQVDAALAKSGLDRACWQDSLPQAPRRESNSPYVRHTTQLFLEAVNLEPFITFLWNLLHNDATLSLTALQLSAPRTDSKDDHWNAKASFTYVIYAPNSK